MAEENIENRYYYSPQHNITVTFFLKYGAATIKGRYFADGGPPSHLTNLSYHELGQRVHDWEFHHGDLLSAELNVLYRADAMVLLRRPGETTAIWYSQDRT